MARAKAQRDPDDDLRPCEADNCCLPVVAPRRFCLGHWDFVPDHEREALFEAHTSGKKEDIEEVLGRITARIASVEEARRGKKRD